MPSHREGWGGLFKATVPINEQRFAIIYKEGTVADPLPADTKYY
jgi:hypothetical protein